MSKSDVKLQFQSYIFSSSKYNWSVYEKRIVYRMIEIEQKMLNQEMIDKCIKIENNLWGDRKYTMPVGMLLGTDENADENSLQGRSKNNKRIIDAFSTIQDKKVKYEDDKLYGRVGVIDGFEFKKNERNVTWKADAKIIEMIMDFSKGWRAYELKIAFNLRSAYAMRFYELIGNKKSKITYTTDKLIKMFELEDKYRQKSGKPNYAAIEEFVIKKAQDELDKVSPYTFNYRFSKDKSTIDIIPIFQEQFSSAKYEKKNEVNLNFVFSETDIQTLINEFGFTEQGLKNNYALFEECKKVLPENYTYFMFQQIRESIKRSPKKVGQGYIIEIFKNQLNGFKAKNK